MHIVLSLTVSEFKRLIAKGMAQADFVRRAIDERTLAKGSMPSIMNGNRQQCLSVIPRAEGLAP